MLGIQVDRNTIDRKASAAVLNLRSAFEQVETINEWLTNNPTTTDGSGSTVDPLINTYQYSSDEAYALRLFFQTTDGIRTANQSTWDIGRKMTGLE